MTPVMLIVDFRSFVTEGKRVQFMFNDADAGRVTHDAIVAAAEAYRAKHNDREQTLTFETASGPATVDVSEILSIALDDPFGKGAAALEVWNMAAAAAVGRAEAVRDAAKAKEPTQGADHERV